MTDPIVTEIVATAALAGLMIIAFVGLRAWRDWLALRRLELEGHRSPDAAPLPNPGARIELADLKERVRKLEAIAAGVDL